MCCFVSMFFSVYTLPLAEFVTVLGPAAMIKPSHPDPASSPQGTTQRWKQVCVEHLDTDTGTCIAGKAQSLEWCSPT
ncbi:hypothetical protein PF005_g6330 [Phytophthora fragariae]|uniref:Secreted protein n=2 Tax=Phytophthora TaxID=4783 RepID=A0A6A3UI73_9STRA|nr:hypothetical protein PF003_g21543 [Phytophthora fragariae]KAE9036002.1 hypothetical protein PR002_g7292 [Phytophthora rubi]KAE8943214.1 hypothetical protein PF009_g7047 [Phytophthora fragariae]KAE9014220.1 hypothetical protein PF011_g8154 [Phytophthora fragariae]KAE9040756.1 hypothetical protein PR001_g6927 [Phytophthora rubi]